MGGGGGVLDPPLSGCGSSHDRQARRLNFYRGGSSLNMKWTKPSGSARSAQ